MLVFSTLCIQSCADEANAAAVDAQLAALSDGGEDGATEGAGSSGSTPGGAAAADDVSRFPVRPHVRCCHVKWLMHWTRSVALQHMGGVAFLSGDQQRQAECLRAAQLVSRRKSQLTHATLHPVSHL